MSTGRNHDARRWRYFSFAVAGVAVGAMGMVLGAYLASGDNRWAYGLYHSAAGIVGASLAICSWATHRFRRAQTFAGIAVLIGFLSGMTMLFELTEEDAALTATVTESPFAFALWFLIWILWVSIAVWRLIVIKPSRVRKRRLPSHHD